MDDIHLTCLNQAWLDRGQTQTPTGLQWSEEFIGNQADDFASFALAVIYDAPCTLSTTILLWE